jgi:hypothetical protein
MNKTELLQRFEVFMNNIKEPETVALVKVDRRTFREIQADVMSRDFLKPKAERDYLRRHETVYYFTVDMGYDILIENAEDWNIECWEVVRKPMEETQNTKEWTRMKLAEITIKVYKGESPIDKIMEIHDVNGRIGLPKLNAEEREAIKKAAEMLEHVEKMEAIGVM